VSERRISKDGPGLVELSVPLDGEDRNAGAEGRVAECLHICDISDDIDPGFGPAIDGGDGIRRGVRRSGGKRDGREVSRGEGTPRSERPD
jgi:hypothetical protein